MKKLLPKSLNNPQGFTLIELLVVITIIAFLAVIGIVSFTAVQAQARDGRRRTDIDAISTAMESNRDPVAGTYPAYSASIFANNVRPCDPLDSTPSTCASSVSTTLITYSGTPGYGYLVTVGTTPPYYACAKLEKGGGNGNGTVDSSGNLAAGTTHYCRRSQQ